MKKKEEITDQSKTPELLEKPKSKKITEPHTNPLFFRENTREKRENLTAALYNDTHNSIIY